MKNKKVLLKQYNKSPNKGLFHAATSAKDAGYVVEYVVCERKHSKKGK
jgi:hypothetical protein